MKRHVTFFKQFLAEPQTVGAIAPSSAALARALCLPYSRGTEPCRVLEVGAGTGAVTRYLGRILRPSDRLDICEISPEFVEVLERDIVSSDAFADARRTGRVRVLAGPVQDVVGTAEYDFVISGLPLNAFPLELVQEVLGAIRRCLVPGGIFSYFEYMAFRRLGATVGSDSRLRQVSNYLDEQIRNFQFDCNYVFRNFPPAAARHWRFADAESPIPTGATPVHS